MTAALSTLRRWLGLLSQMGRLMCGVPDYAAYVRHMRKTHPNCAAMSEEAFFRARQDARYARGMSRCC